MILGSSHQARSERSSACRTCDEPLPHLGCMPIIHPHANVHYLLHGQGANETSADRLKGWQHDDALRSLLEESEPSSFDGNTSDTSRPRLIWAQEREKRLIATKQEAEAAARSMQG